LAHAPRAASPRARQDRSRRCPVARSRGTYRQGRAAEEPEIVRALATIELQRRRFARDRIQAIRRPRSDWTQHDPVSEAGTVRCDRQRELRKLKRINLGDSLAQEIAARCIRELARDIEDLNQRIAALDGEIAQLLLDYGNPLEDLDGAGGNLTATIIAQAGDVRRFRDASVFARFCGAAPIPGGSGQTSGRHRLHRGGNRQLNAALYSIAIVQQRHYPDATRYLARKSQRAKHPAKPAEPSNATSPTSSTDASTPGPKTRSQHKSLDIGESSASSAPSSAAGPTARSTPTAQNAPPPLTAGSGTTTIYANTSPRPPPPIARLTGEPTSSGLTARAREY
jgi:transposase